MKSLAILFILGITSAGEHQKTQFELTSGRYDLTWDECYKTAQGINEASYIEVGEVTAVCFPLTEKELKKYEDSKKRGHS